MQNHKEILSLTPNELVFLHSTTQRQWLALLDISRRNQLWGFFLPKAAQYVTDIPISFYIFGEFATRLTN